MSRIKRNFLKYRLWSFKFIYFVAFALLLARLYYIQVYNNEELRVSSLKQRSAEIVLNSKRGNIYDRNLELLTNLDKIKTLVGPKEEIVSNKDLLNKIYENTTISIAELNNILKGPNKLITIPIKEDFQTNNKNLFVVDKVNRYSKDNLLSHVIGYSSKSENIGQSGIEKIYDEFLKNTNNSSFYIEYDKNRSIILGSSYYADNTIDPHDPAGVMLTIDKRIQNIIEDTLDKESLKGTVIVANVEDGEILGLASRPNFNQDNIIAYLNKEDMALYNKAIQVSYPPGSIFKIVVLLAALEENISIVNKEFYCNGIEVLNNTNIKCTGIHGNISLKDGFAKSCNSVFIQLGKEIGAKAIINMAKRLGLGDKVNIGLLEEIEGSLPEGDELLGPAIGNISIGQGKIEITPIQITKLLLTIANNGIDKDLNIVKGITTFDGLMIKPYLKNDPSRKISDEISKITREFLEEVMISGTASRLELEEIGGAGGKTGSAEGVLKGRPVIHGWFAGYYPKENPKYVITVLIEEASSGSQSAAPVFEKICKEIYLNIK